MKKLLLSLGALASVAAPVAAVVACGSSTPEAKFETATPEQETAVTAVTNKITPLAGGLPKTSTEISGNKVRYTFGTVPTAADASDDASTVTAKTYVVKTFTVDLESGKIIDAQAAETDGKFESIIDSQEVKDAAADITTASETAKTALEQANADAALVKAKEDAKSKVAVISGIADANKTIANAAIDAAKDQTEIDAAIAAAQASVAPAHATTGSTADIDQDAVDAEQAVVNGLVASEVVKSNDTDTTRLMGTFSKIIANNLGLTTFAKKDGYSYDITGTTPTTITVEVSAGVSGITGTNPTPITLNIKDAVTQPAGKGTPTAGTGAPAQASTDDAAVATFATDTMTVEVTLKADDFKSHIDGLISIAIANASGFDFETQSKDIKHIKVTLKDGTKIIDGEADVPKAVASGTATQAQINTVINTAIAEASEKAADKLKTNHDIAMDATDYVSKMSARISNVDMSGDTVADANNILAAVGNATRFTSDTSYKPVFGDEVTTGIKSAKDEIAKLLAAYITSEQAHKTITTALQAKIDAID